MQVKIHNSSQDKFIICIKDMSDKNYKHVSFTLNNKTDCIEGPIHISNLEKVIAESIDCRLEQLETEMQHSKDPTRKEAILAELEVIKHKQRRVFQ